MFVDVNGNHVNFFSSNASCSDSVIQPVEDKCSISFLLNNDTVPPVVEERDRQITLSSYKSSWSEAEMHLLKEAVGRYGINKWKWVAAFTGKHHMQCKVEWEKSVNPDCTSGFWSQSEDDRLKELVRIHGEREWVTVALSMPGRTNAHCRNRWKILKSKQLKGTDNHSWLLSEDKMLENVLKNESIRDWKEIAQLISGKRVQLKV